MAYRWKCELCGESSSVGPHDPAECVAALRARALPHQAPADCSLWYDGCHCLEAIEGDRPVYRIQRDALAEALRDVEWFSAGSGGATICPLCRRFQQYGHATDCRLAAALAKVQPSPEVRHGG